MAPSSPSAPPAMSLLLPFCQFLLHRVQTDNLELLQRAAAEFLSPSPRFETVESMIRLAFPLVAMLPVDHGDADQRVRAGAILARMQLRNSGSPSNNVAEFARFRAALAARVELTNWHWLEQIFAEFCVGQDACLREFVALQRQAISIVPLRSVVVSPRHAVVSGSAAETATHRVSRIADSADKIKRKKTNWQKVRSEGRHAVFKELLAIEKQRPWETVFDVANIEYPFDENTYPVLASELKTFWARHARAVWERLFWFYYGGPREHASRQEDRKCRQDIATRAFESRVMVRAYDALGPSFFVDLDLSPQRHYWWWYREPVVDMLRMGGQQCLEYLRSKAFERFPDPPRGFELHKHRHSAKGRTSFWAALAKYQEHREVTEKLKNARLTKAL